MPKDKKRDYGTGSIYKQKGTKRWTIKYTDQHGKVVREATGSTSFTYAKKLLKKRNAEVTDGSYVPHDRKVTFEDLVRLIEQDYVLNDQRSLKTLKISIGHLREVFGMDRAEDITSARIRQYVYDRLQEGARPATVHKEKSALRRMFNLAIENETLRYMPKFPVIKIDNARQEFFEEAEFALFMLELPEYLRPLIEFAYLTGWRIKSELLGIGVSKQPFTWEKNVDFDAGEVKLLIRTTKNNKPRVFPFAALPQLKALLDRQRQYTDEWEQKTGKQIPRVFHNEGVPIRDFRAAWNNACARAGLAVPAKDEDGNLVLDKRVKPVMKPIKVPHDLRRTAVRNLVRAGVSENVAMKLTGHKTRDVFERYNITSKTDLDDAAEKLARLHCAKNETQSADLGIDWA